MNRKHFHLTVYLYQCMCMLSLFSHVQLFGTLWTLSMGFFRQEYWSGFLSPPPGYLPDPRIAPVSLMSPALAGGFFTTSVTWEAHVYHPLIHRIVWVSAPWFMQSVPCWWTFRWFQTQVPCCTYQALLLKNYIALVREWVFQATLRQN